MNLYGDSALIKNHNLFLVSHRSCQIHNSSILESGKTFQLDYLESLETCQCLDETIGATYQFSTNSMKSGFVLLSERFRSENLRIAQFKLLNIVYKETISSTVS